jgi:hypothetical protein
MSDAELPINHDAGIDVSSPQFYPGSATSTGALGLMNPDSMLGGTLRGTQFVGSNTLQIDSTQNLITIKNSAAALNQTGVLRIGTVAQNYLGMAVNNGTVDTMFAGQDSTGATVVKIAKAGYDAKTATDDQLIFNSNQNVFKIVSKIQSNIPAFSWVAATSASSLLTIPHGLSATPIINAYAAGNLINSSTGTVLSASYIPIPIFGNADTLYYAFFDNASSVLWPLAVLTGVDSTNIYIEAVYKRGVAATGNVAAIPVTIFIMQETAN